MNECCEMKGNAKIVYSKKPGIHWRVMCQYCGLILHEQKGEENNEKSDKNQNKNN